MSHKSTQKKDNIKETTHRMFEKKPDSNLDENQEKRQQMVLDSIRSIKV